MSDQTVRELDRILFEARRDHFGRDHAKDLTKELKGSSLLSNNTFRIAKKYGSSRNLALVQQIFDQCVACQQDHPIWIFGAVVYGAVGVLTQLGSDRLLKPVADILDKMSVASSVAHSKQRVNLVFDSQICGSEPDIAAAVRRFVSGVKLLNVSHYPLVGVSHVSPGIQLADICAFILGRKAIADPNFDVWLTSLRRLEWEGYINRYHRQGIQRWEPNGAKLQIRQTWK